MDAIIERIEVRTSHIQTFWLKPSRRLRHTAGEFVEVSLPHADADDRGDQRWFTLYSSPTEQLVAITSKFADKQSSSFKQALRSLRPGDTLHLSDPMGDFLLPKSTGQTIVFVARGIGITPIRSISKWLVDTGENRDVRLLYSVSAAEEAIDTALFDQAYGDKWQLTTQRVTTDTVRALAASGTSPLYYLAGPEAMVTSIVQELRASGVPPYAIVTDYFPGYPS